jgi:protein-S-isoprenylcysteine O-methyltransferase Ste14
MSNLAARAWFALGFLTMLLAFLLFVPAGTIRYWQAWVFLTIFFVGSALTTQYIIRNDPALLARRMKGGPTAEKRAAEKIIMLGTVFCFIALLVVPALDHRYAWSRVPLSVVLTGHVLFVVGFYFIYRVYRENTFASATIEVVENQKVISTGPYAIVRHPMYASALIYLVGIPLTLGSYWGFVPLALMLPLLVWRLFDEERLLSETLPGYREYQKKVRNRLIPRFW